MNSNPTLVTHPSAETLQAFSLGKLDDAATEGVLRHLETCTDCHQQAATLSADGFLKRLRDTHGRSGTAIPTRSVDGGARSLYATRMPENPLSAIAGLPPELVNHPQYDVLRELGRGGMGVVYLAKNVLMDRMEVLKVLGKAVLVQEGAGERFLREIRSAAKLNHNNVVKAYSALQLGELLVFAMEYVEGEDLSRVVKQRGPLPVPSACFYAHQAACGLAHAHEHGMIHRDIKPHNLILSQQGKKHVVKILDFGLAKAAVEKDADTELTGTGMMLGTPDYIAPEQTMDAAHTDIRADIYSLGCTLYFLLTGAAPFKGKSVFEILQAHLSTEAKALDQVREGVPPELAAVVAKMMAKDPAQRYQTPIEVAQALMPFIKARAKAAPPTGAAEKGATPKESGTTETMIAATATIGGARHKAAGQTLRAPAPKSALRKWWLVGAGAAAVAGVALLLLLTVVVLWGAGVFRVKTADGSILVVEVNEANADVFVDGEKVTVTWGDGGKKAELRVKPGTRKVEVKKDGFTIWGEEVEIEDGKRRILTARLSQDVPPPPEGKGKQHPLALDLGGGVTVRFVRVPKGTFWMGWTSDKKQSTQVTIDTDFELGVYTVTQEQWQTLMLDNPSEFSRFGVGKDRVAQVSSEDLKRFPVENVSWNDAQVFLRKLNTREDGKGWLYRLPREAEWEYAGRNAATTKEECSFDFYFDRGTNDLSSNQANFNGNFPAGNAAKGPFLGRPTRVGSYAPNKLGLYDMQGNVWQWCADPWNDKSGPGRVRRGGSWVSPQGHHCRAAFRTRIAPANHFGDLGFRVARVPVPPVAVAQSPPKDKKELPTANPQPPPTVPLVASIVRKAVVNGGKWKIDGDDLVQEGSTWGEVIIGDASWTDYNFDCESQWVNGSAEIGVVFRYTAAGREMFFLGGWGNKQGCVTTMRNGRIFKQRRFGDVVKKDVWNQLSVKVRGRQCECYRNGLLVSKYDDPTSLQGQVSVYAPGPARFRNIRVTDPQGKVLFDGMPELPTIKKEIPEKEAAKVGPSDESKVVTTPAHELWLYSGREAHQLLDYQYSHRALTEALTGTWPSSFRFCDLPAANILSFFLGLAPAKL